MQLLELIELSKYVTKSYGLSAALFKGAFL